MEERDGAAFREYGGTRQWHIMRRCVCYVLCVLHRCPVSVTLQPSLHATGRERAPGPGGVPEEHEEPHGDLQVRTTQAPQEGAQPQEGVLQAQATQAHSDWLLVVRCVTGVLFVLCSAEDPTPRRTAVTSPSGMSVGTTKVCDSMTLVAERGQCCLSCV